jgi:predicted DNA-binding transcriptional regulator AlpA
LKGVERMPKASPSKRPAAQAALAKARSSATSPALIDANGSAWLGGHLLAKRDVLAITNVTFPTLWAWMRAGKFPRARVVGAKSMWLSTDIEAWLATLPVRRLKGDAPEAPASEKPAGVELSRSFLRGRAS